ncbi:MAG: type I restriction enzyme HsdR N-terminal domain-containing protein [Anaerolineae bacterium]|nr:type I restriction enzyme HsdR N-terminal domain-containing protein [Anaerolineae bacterium]MCO5195408.1 type I restriction enzyme HsdR N-terminal domain-containing protein [Anaerolineae bacterium]
MDDFILCCIPTVLILIMSVLAIDYYNLKQKYAVLRTEMEKDKVKLQSTRDLIANLRAENKEKTLSEWLEEIQNSSYRNEIEVEIKFVYPFIKLLGYQEGDFDVRVPVNIQVGSNNNRIEADWVVWRNNNSEKRQAHIVIEAKGPNQDLNLEVQAQARSYAFALDAPIYMNTNGKRVQVFHRGIQKDNCVVNCLVNELSDHWAVIQKSLQK